MMAKTDTLSEERYERLVWMIFFETLTILTVQLFASHIKSEFQMLTFAVAIGFFQIPFVSFITNDFLGRRPSLIDKIFKWVARMYIVLIVIGIIAVIMLLDWKTGVAGILVTTLFIIIQNWGKIEAFITKGGKAQSGEKKTDKKKKSNSSDEKTL